jgi:hypothetical protein
MIAHCSDHRITSLHHIRQHAVLFRQVRVPQQLGSDTVGTISTLERPQNGIAGTVGITRSYPSRLAPPRPDFLIQDVWWTIAVVHDELPQPRAGIHHMTVGVGHLT